MELIRLRYPSLSLERLRELAAIVVAERNAVVEINRVWSQCPWGLGCLCCEAVLRKIQSIAGKPPYEWLEFEQEIGMAYTTKVDKVPLRIQPDIDVIRAVMPGERQALDQFRAVQRSLFPGMAPTRSEILRLETMQRPGAPVSQVTLYLLNELTGAILDRELLYSAASEGAELRRPARDVNVDDVFSFPPANDKAEDGGA